MPSYKITKIGVVVFVLNLEFDQLVQLFEKLAFVSVPLPETEPLILTVLSDLLLNGVFFTLFLNYCIVMCT